MTKKFSHVVAHIIVSLHIGGSNGALRMHTLLSPISFIFLQFSAKTLPNNGFSLENQGLPHRLGNSGSTNVVDDWSVEFVPNSSIGVDLLFVDHLY